MHVHSMTSHGQLQRHRPLSAHTHRHAHASPQSSPPPLHCPQQHSSFLTTSSPRTLQDAPTYVTASDSFDTVILAVGRQASTASLNLAAAGIEADAETGKVDAVHEQTSVPHVYAVGDVVRQRAELTPVAVMAGRRLARRLFGGEGEAGAVLEYDEVRVGAQCWSVTR